MIMELEDNKTESRVEEQDAASQKNTGLDRYISTYM